MLLQWHLIVVYKSLTPNAVIAGLVAQRVRVDKDHPYRQTIVNRRTTWLYKFYSRPSSSDAARGPNGDDRADMVMGDRDSVLPRRSLSSSSGSPSASRSSPCVSVCVCDCVGLSLSGSASPGFAASGSGSPRCPSAAAPRESNVTSAGILRIGWGEKGRAPRGLLKSDEKTLSASPPGWCLVSDATPVRD